MEKMKISLLMIIYCYFLLFWFGMKWGVFGTQIISKSSLETCEKVSDNLNCTKKMVLNLYVPSGSSGGEASIVVTNVEENSTQKMVTPRIPPVITVSKSDVYALYDITYMRDVAFKPQEFYVETRKCEPDADKSVVGICERLLDENGHIIEKTQPICCPCEASRAPSSCGNEFDRRTKGKRNTAHCLRFLGDWFHVFAIEKYTLGYSVRIEVKTESKVWEVILGPESRTVVSNDNFLRANLMGDFVGYTNIPTFANDYLVIPRQGGPGQPQDLGRNFSMWMLLEKERFTLNGLECNKIGVDYEGFNRQQGFCSSPNGSCLEGQLWTFWDDDQKRISEHKVPLYGVEGKYKRINQHPNAGNHSFSIGITEVLNTNILIELTADDIEFVYGRSRGKILNLTVPAFEALTQVGNATITITNIGEVEASYSLTFNCSESVGLMEEQIFTLKPNEPTTRSFKLYTATDHSAHYICTAILKDAYFSEVDRAECRFSTTATVINNGSQITPFQPSKPDTKGFFDSIKSKWNNFWVAVADFITGKACRGKCSGFFDISCHIRYICMNWIIMFCLLLLIVLVLLWFLHQKGFFDHLHDLWEDLFPADSHRKDVQKHGDVEQPHIHRNKHHKPEATHRKHDTHKRRSSHDHVHKDKHKNSSSGAMEL